MDSESVMELAVVVEGETYSPERKRRLDTIGRSVRPPRMSARSLRGTEELQDRRSDGLPSANHGRWRSRLRASGGGWLKHSNFKGPARLRAGSRFSPKPWFLPCYTQ